MSANSLLRSSTPSVAANANSEVCPTKSEARAASRLRRLRAAETLHSWRSQWQRRIADDTATLCPSIRFLSHQGFDQSTLKQASELGQINGTNAASEMMAAGQLSRQYYDQALARAAGLSYVTADDIKTVLVPLTQTALLLQPHGLHWCRLKDDRLCGVAIVDPAQTDFFIGHIKRSQLSDRLVVSSHAHLKHNVIANRAHCLREQTTNRLLNRAPKDSALAGASFGQGVILTLFVGIVIFGYIAGPTLGGLVLHTLLSLFFIACALMRVGASLQRTKHAHHNTVVASDHCNKPVYTVLVTLLDEVAVVPGLVHYLSKLQWPATKLDIKLVCEEHDLATIAALRAQHLDSRFEIIIVPPGGPTTKPNALCYAMAFCRGTLVTLYDAEDRPHPMQLEEAWQRFRTAGPTLGCLQAPLQIANATQNQFTALFHMEYAGLFKRILPWLAQRNLPLPLGGTSNHFQRHALEDVGLWDPYNVTEDADLGYRLWEAGYEVGTISLPTVEDAPKTFAAWLPQRTRWFKGWMQTWIVHSRKSKQIVQRHGLWRFILAHIVLTGIIVSALLHPLVLLSAIGMALWLAGSVFSAGDQLFLLAIDTATLVLSYAAFCVLGFQATDPDMRKEIGHHVWATPLYWMAMSVAAWRALFQMFYAPFHWEKTPHEAYAFDPDNRQ